MDRSIYEVERDDYAGFIGQLNKAKCDVEQSYEPNQTIMTIRSKKSGNILCIRVIPEEDIEKYYVINMPDDDERVAPKPVMKVTLETQEEVQDFFNALSKVQKGEIDGRDIHKYK